MDKIKAKYGNKHTVIIPAEIRNQLGLVQGEYFDAYLDGNRIILERCEKGPDVILVNDKSSLDTKVKKPAEIQTPTKTKDEDKSKLQELLEDTQKQPETYWDRGILKHKIKEEEIEPSVCECGNYIEDSRFIINNKVVCKTCRDNLKEKMIMDIKYHNRLKELNKD